MDILRERSARLSTAECTIDSMRKKVEEANDLKRQLRKLEEKNAQYIQQNVELEEVRHGRLDPRPQPTNVLLLHFCKITRHHETIWFIHQKALDNPASGFYASINEKAIQYSNYNSHCYFIKNCPVEMKQLRLFL